jgi:hypothetical protein
LVPHYWISGLIPPIAPLRSSGFEGVELPEVKEPAEGTEDDFNLRSAQEVIGYRIGACDGDIGHVEHLIVDDDAWMIRYLVIDTRNWLPGRRVMLAPSWVESIDWEVKKIHVPMSRDAVEKSPGLRPKSSGQSST